jgi:signal transduction histidine kinase/CheY-like chemotaxis protein
MAKILVLDDELVNRQFLDTLLGYAGHEILEAADAASALTKARHHRPDLIIADLLMPGVDGYEFVRRLRNEPEIAQTQVMFYSAFYREQEARELAESCGVPHLLSKPTDPEIILQTVESILMSAPGAQAASVPDQFERQHSRLLSDRLCHTASSLRAVNARLMAVLEIGQQLAAERDGERLIRRLCPAARQILGCAYAGAVTFDCGAVKCLTVSGAETQTLARIRELLGDQTVLGQISAAQGPVRLRLGNIGPATGSAADSGILGVPLRRPQAPLGVLVFAAKMGPPDFTAEDEEIATTIAAQAAVAYENAVRYRDLQRHTAELEHEVAERRKIEAALCEREDELAQKVVELTAANHDLEVFTYSIAHDLRAPLRHIDGFSRILLNQAAQTLEPTGLAYLHRVREGSQQLGRMIDDLLTLAQTGRRVPQKLPVRLNGVVDEVLQNLKPDAEGRPVEWRIGPLPSIRCDAALIKQVFVNLLDNALKFSAGRDPAVIEIGELAGNREPVIFVRDNGVGFNMKYADKLFGIFQRLHPQDRFNGSGVGLATVSRIVQKHGGRIWAESQEDCGATFLFTLGTTSPSGEEAQTVHAPGAEDSAG